MRKIEQTVFGGWLERVLATQPEEITCSDCFDQISHYVDLEVAGKDPAATLPDVAHHLSQCPACAEEHQALLGLAWMEAIGHLPDTETLLSELRCPN
jgi:hypothetical protein